MQTTVKGSFAAVIPAFNESKTIAEVVRGVSMYAVPIVVDDGSSDATYSLACDASATVVRHSVNQGYDAALQSGLFKAINLGFEFAVTLDADAQHKPQTIEIFRHELLKGADLVVGARDRHQRFSESLFAIVGKMLWNISDPLCGMKGYRLSHLKRFGSFDSYRSIGTEFTIRCARQGLKITSVPVETMDRRGPSRFGVGIGANLKILRALLLGVTKTTNGLGKRS